MSNKYTEQDLIEIFGLHQQGLSQRKIAEITGVPKSTIGDLLIQKQQYVKEFCKDLGKDIVGGSEDITHDKRKKMDAGIYLITSAQNNTKLHDKAWDTLQSIASYYDAEILVSTFTYNTSGFQNLTKDSDELWYDPRIKPYIVNEPVELAEDLLLCGELNILPTAVNPLSGFQNYVTSHSGIIPHAKISMESLPRHKGDMPRFLYSTGAITLPNYIQKKVGQKAEFYHAIGALLVEVDEDGDWWVRQLHAEKGTGVIYDLTNRFDPEGVEEGVTIHAINLGDLHIEKSDPEVLGLSTGLYYNKGEWEYDPNNILMDLYPEHIFCHDTADFSARNHHNINDHYFRFLRHHSDFDRVQDEMEMVGTFLGQLSMHNPYSKVVVVESNHDTALEKWLKTADYRNDPSNATFFLGLQHANYSHMEEFGEPLHLFKYACELSHSHCENVVFLDTDESYRLFGKDGIECGQHGHNGVNGARGSKQAFTKLGLRYNVGHSHSAGIYLGCFYAGVTGSLDMGYNVGGTTWSHSHILTYENGKRAIITYRGGKFY